MGWRQAAFRTLISHLLHDKQRNESMMAVVSTAALPILLKDLLSKTSEIRMFA